MNGQEQCVVLGRPRDPENVAGILQVLWQKSLREQSAADRGYGRAWADVCEFIEGALR